MTSAWGMTEDTRKSLDAQLAAKGFTRGSYQAVYRGMRDGAWTPKAVDKYDSRDAMLAILDALIHQGSITAWPGDGTSCVEQMLALVYAERDTLRTSLDAAIRDLERSERQRLKLESDCMKAGFAADDYCKQIDALRAALADFRKQVRETNLGIQDNDCHCSGRFAALLRLTRPAHEALIGSASQPSPQRSSYETDETGPLCPICYYPDGLHTKNCRQSQTPAQLTSEEP